MLTETDKALVRMGAHIVALEQAIGQIQKQLEDTKQELSTMTKAKLEKEQQADYLANMLKAASAEKAGENHV